MGEKADDDLSLASEVELGQIAELRDALKEELDAVAAAGHDFPHTTGDVFMLRVLRGNDRQIPLAVEWYRKFLELRKANGFDDIHKSFQASPKPYSSENMPRYQEVSKFYHQRFDEVKLQTPDGHLIWYDGMGKVDTEQLLGSGKEVFLEFFRHACEGRLSCLDRLTKERGSLVKFVRIVDFDGFSLSQYNRQTRAFVRGVIVPMMTTSAAETVQRLLIVNAPWFVVKLCTAFQRTLPHRISARTRIYGRDFMQQEECIKHVGTDKLVELMSAKGSVMSDREDGAMTGSARVIPAGQFMERYVPVEKGQTVSWEFAVGSPGGESRGIAGKVLDKAMGEGTDVQFGATFFGQLDGEEVQEETIAAPAMFDASSPGGSGSYAASSEGTVLLRWSNFHSWVRAKMLDSYQVQVC